MLMLGVIIISSLKRRRVGNKAVNDNVLGRVDILMPLIRQML